MKWLAASNISRDIGISVQQKALTPLFAGFRSAAHPDRLVIPTWGQTEPHRVVLKPVPFAVPEFEQGLELLWLGFPRSRREGWPFHTISKRL
jgi:hypothetical protein